MIQAVADAMNLKIHIIESREHFGELTLVESARHNLLQNSRSIFIGHIGEMHYVSTCSVSIHPNSNEIDSEIANRSNISCTSDLANGQNYSNTNVTIIEKERKEQNVMSTRYNRAAMASPEKRAKRNDYQRNYRASLAPEKKAKRNQYLRNYIRAQKSQEKNNKRNE